MGSSQPWPEAMHAITGQRKMDASAFREYFKPLELWLIKKNGELNETIGWNKGTSPYQIIALNSNNHWPLVFFFSSPDKASCRKSASAANTSQLDYFIALFISVIASLMVLQN